ncbi:MAG: hypothetical protein K2X81_08310 [Candidatus Obscuribacterales bacterium]|nr:hypothetical protein [Candidatus Obscuribacterales bacterium]
MKLIVAIIQPEKLDYLTAALRRAGVRGVTVTQARGFGDENAAYDWNLRGDLTSKLKVETVVSDEVCDEIVMVIQSTVAKGSREHAFLYVIDVVKTVHFFTGETEVEDNIE